MTAVARTGYRGRFAPSPTGPLHLGSLVTAVASYLAARAHRGEWLLRIEDIDPPRASPGAAEAIIESLHVHGFEWDRPVSFQSHSHEAHAAALELLERADLTYLCDCSRAEIRQAGEHGSAGSIYPGTCRKRGLRDNGTETALRLRTDANPIEFIDEWQGPISCVVEREIGDFVLRRKDGLVGYNLAVVVDDARDQITQVVRGRDLLAFTPAQIFLQRCLGQLSPSYAHAPVVVDQFGVKLSKQTGAQPIENARPAENLRTALQMLRQNPPAELGRAPVREIWTWAISHWRPSELIGETEISAP